MHAATTRMLKILAVVVAVASVVGAVYFWVTGHPIPATGCIVGGTTFLAAAWFTITRESEPSSTAANQKRRRYDDHTPRGPLQLNSPARSVSSS